MQKFLSLLFSFIAFSAFAQDDLLKQLQSEAPPENEPVIATFKGFKIINIQTNETTPKGNLDFRIGHLFGNVGGDAGYHDMYGLFTIQDVRIGFHYGITQALTVGIARYKRNEAMEGLLKLRLLQQKPTGMPVSVTLYGEMTATLADEDDAPLLELGKTAHRFNYCSQLIITRKFSPGFSFVLAPSYVHRNIVPDSINNELCSIGAGFRLKFTRSSALVADYFYNFWPESPSNHEDALGIGVEIETGGHVFTLMFTNASGLAENDFIPYTEDSWSDGGFKLSFNISRMFKL